MFIDMAKIPYSKQIQSFDDQVCILKERGMAFRDEKHARQINPSNTFHSKIKSLFAEYPHIDINAMGFPANWETNHLWK